MDLFNPILAILSIAMGAFGFLAPRYTAQALDLTPGNTTMGLSEMRASVGGLFVATGIACLVLGDPLAYLMMGVAYTGAATGRLLSCLVDRPAVTRAWIFFAIEAAMAIALLAINLSA
ncbi:MAG: DUF4345 family protein [Pseudomonadota bacterium]